MLWKVNKSWSLSRCLMYVLAWHFLSFQTSLIFFLNVAHFFFLFGFDFYIEIREGRNKIFRSSRKFEAYVEEMASGDTVSGADDVLK